MQIIELPELPACDRVQASIFSTEIVSDFGNVLVQEAAQLGTSFGFEPSVRLSPGRLSVNRFLITLTCDSFGSNPIGWLQDFMRRTAMPMDWWSEMEGQMERASFIHFGFEESPDDLLYKFYVEHEVNERVVAAATEPTIPLYTGYKWSVVRPDRQFVTDYRWFPNITWPAIQSHLQRLLQPAEETTENRVSPSWQFFQSLLPRLTTRTDWSPRLSEVTEAHSPRRSYDLNVYDAMQPLRDLKDEIFELARSFSIPDEQLEAWFTPCQNRLLGHLAAGRQRSGDDFVTIYYGAQSYDA